MKVKLVCIMLSLLVMAFGVVPMAFAEDAATDPVGVAGCGAVKLDPNESMGAQQVICDAAEGKEESSCAASGHGRCSSPKLNDVLPDADHCICIAETPTTDTASTEEPAA